MSPDEIVATYEIIANRGYVKFKNVNDKKYAMWYPAKGDELSRLYLDKDFPVMCFYAGVTDSIESTTKNLEKAIHHKYVDCPQDKYELYDSVKLEYRRKSNVA